MKWLAENLFFLLIAGILTAIGVFFFGPSLLAKFKDTSVPTGSENSGTGGTAPDPEFPLKLGSKGNNVKSLQHYLNSTGSYALQEDGIFGANTEAAVASELTGLPAITNPKQVPQWYFDQFIKGKF